MQATKLPSWTDVDEDRVHAAALDYARACGMVDASPSNPELQRYTRTSEAMHRAELALRDGDAASALELLGRARNLARRDELMIERASAPLVLNVPDTPELRERLRAAQAAPGGILSALPTDDRAAELEAAVVELGYSRSALRIAAQDRQASRARIEELESALAEERDARAAVRAQNEHKRQLIDELELTLRGIAAHARDAEAKGQDATTDIRVWCEGATEHPRQARPSRVAELEACLRTLTDNADEAERRITELESALREMRDVLTEALPCVPDAYKRTRLAARAILRHASELLS